MLAKETKIQNLIWQREFIKKQLVAPRKDGDPSYRYRGYIFPENVKYFTDEGYEITIIPNPKEIENAEGLNLYVFIPDDSIELTPEEETTSKNIAINSRNLLEEFDEFVPEEAKSFMADIFSEIARKRNEFPDADEESF